MLPPAVYLTRPIVDLGGDGGQIVWITGDLDVLSRYSRTTQLRFSLLPRSHGECGWAKYTGNPLFLAGGDRSSGGIGPRRVRLLEWN